VKSFLPSQLDNQTQAELEQIRQTRRETLAPAKQKQLIARAARQRIASLAARK
jgi:hypothetical protein